MQPPFTLDETIRFIETDYRDYRIAKLRHVTPDRIDIIDKLVQHWNHRLKYAHFEFVYRDLCHLYDHYFPELNPDFYVIQ